MRKFIVVALLLVATGCSSITDQSKFESMCSGLDSLVCNIPEENSLLPDMEYLNVMAQLFTPNIHYTEESPDTWSHNDTVYEPLYGDCEDIAFTFANQLLLDGIDPSVIWIVFSYGNGEAHIHIEVEAIDGVFVFYDNKSLTEFKRIRLDKINLM